MTKKPRILLLCLFLLYSSSSYARSERVSTAGYLAGAVLGTFPLPYLPLALSAKGGAQHVPLFPVFGLGHVFQGRFKDRGWIFAVAEASLAVGVAAFGTSCIGEGENFGDGASCGIAVGAFYTYLAVRAFEVADLWITPLVQNARYDEELERSKKVKVAPFFAPFKGGAMVGVLLR